jgi:hypothetical protein
VELTTKHAVVIRGLRVTDNRRARAWARLNAVPDAGWLKPVACLESEDRRIEILSAGSGRTLRDWVGTRRVSVADVEAIVRQLAEALQALHAGDVAHLDLRPEHVVVEGEAGPRVRLGGLERATALAPGEHVVLHGNPFYAPPESVGLFRHAAERTLLAWDWWTLGRLVQELILGKHILGEILHRDVSRETQELQARAESLLAEHEGTTRAGAVEQMPTMDATLTHLLRGLLASCAGGRWGFAEVQRWLAHEPVRDRYDLSRHDRLFVCGERTLTVPEAAELFGKTELWTEGITQLFQSEKKDSLRQFLAQNPAQAKAHEKLENALKLEESIAFKEVPEKIRRELVASIAWTQLAEGLAPARWRGRRIDAALLRAWLSDGEQPEGLIRVQGVLSRVFRQAIRHDDSNTADLLEAYANAFEAARTWVAARGQPIDSVVKERALLLCLLAEESELARENVSMKALYACSRDAAVDALFQKQQPTTYERALVVFSGKAADDFDYVSHAQWREERYLELMQRGEQTAGALFWTQLRHALRAGPVVFSGNGWWIPLAVMPAGAALYAGRWLEAVLLGGLTLAAAVGARLGWWLAQRNDLNRRVAKGQSWGFFDGAKRCAREAERALNAGAPGAADALKAAIAEINSEIGKLSYEPPRPGIDSPAPPTGTWILSSASWLLLLAVLAVGAVQIRNERGREHSALAEAAPTTVPATAGGGGESAVVDVRSGNETRKKVEPWEIKPKPAEVVAPAEEKPAGVYAPPEEEVKITQVAWPFKMSPTAQSVRVRGIVDATSGQLAAAGAAVEDMKKRYDEKTINTMVAVRVPTASGFGLMLYDGKLAKFANNSVFEIAFNPLNRTWLEIGGVRAFYLGAR